MNYPLSRVFFFVPPPCEDVNQSRAQEERWQLNQTGLRAKGAPGDERWPTDPQPKQPKEDQAAHRKAKYNTLEEIPSDMQTNRQPELSGAEIGERQE